MGIHLKSATYRFLIDPLLSGLRDEIVNQAGRPQNLIDIACGTGTLAIDLAEVAGSVTAIDLEREFVEDASDRINKKKISNLHFEVRDASDLSVFNDYEFDIAVTTMSVHQFDENLALQILSEMKRISSCMIIGDYNCPLPGNLSGKVAYNIERLAGGDHYRNFRNYIRRGGLRYFTDNAGLKIIASSIRSSGTFIIMKCE